MENKIRKKCKSHVWKKQTLYYYKANQNLSENHKFFIMNNK